MTVLSRRNRSRPAEVSRKLPLVVPALDSIAIRGDVAGTDVSLMRKVMNRSSVAVNPSCR